MCLNRVTTRNMAAERVECVNKTAFYEAVDVLKSQQKAKQSQITLFVEDKFYDKAKQYLKSIIEDDLIVDQVEEDRITSPLSTWEATTITRKKWKYSNDNIITEKNKKVVSKRHLYDALSLAHNRIAHRGRQLTMKWITENYTEVNQKLVNIFHQEQKTITSRVKLVKQPLQAQTFSLCLKSI